VVEGGASVGVNFVFETRNLFFVSNERNHFLIKQIVITSGIYLTHIYKYK
jgi:hypothetical protein